MMTIRRAQMAALEAAISGPLIEELARGLRENHTDETKAMTDADVLRLARDGYIRSLSWGLSRKADVALFLDLLLTASPEFDRYPPVRFLLAHPDIPDGEKLDRVLARLSARDWDDIRRRATGGAR